MKILIFCPYYPPHIGGLETHADEFNKYLSRRGIDIVVFAPRLPKNAPEREIRYGGVHPHTNFNNALQAEKQRPAGIDVGVKIIRFPAFEIIHNYPLPKFWTKKYRQLKREIKQENFDIVISRTRFFFTSLMAMFFARAKKIKWLHIEHGSDFVKSGGKLSMLVAKIYDFTFGKLVLKKADKVVANSKASAAFCKKLAENIDCEVIYRGVEVEKILAAPADTELKKKYAGKIIITFLGRLFDGKGVADLISALAGIKNENYVCFIIGDGPERKNLETLAKKSGLKEKIVFFGFKNFEEYIKILKISDIFVNPSYTEGLPTTVAEAALCKNTIVATDVGGTPEIITGKKSGFLIKPKDIESLKEKLDLLIEDEDLRKRLENSAFEEVRSKFDWERTIDKYLDIFIKMRKDQ